MQELRINNNRLREIKSLNVDHLPTLSKLDIVNNCFSADHVRHIKQKLSAVDFLTDPFEQKSNEECAKTDQQPSKTSGSNTGSVIIIVISVAAIITILCICFVHRKKLLEKLRVVHKRS